MPRAGRLRPREEVVCVRWTRKEVAFLEWNVDRLTILAISQELGRTEASVERKLRDLNLSGHRHNRPRSEWLTREPLPKTPEEMERINRLHLDDLRRAGHTWWHRVSAEEADMLPKRVPVPDSTFSHSSCIGSPAAMCAE